MTLLRKSEKRSISYQDVWGSGGEWSPVNSWSGERVTSDAALGLDAVWACVNMHAGMASTLPLDAFRGSQAMSPSPLLVSQPSLVLERDEWLFQLFVSLLVWGNAYGLVSGRDRLGHPTTVDWLSPSQVEVEEPRVGGRPVYRVQGQTINTEDVWHLRWFVKPGSVVGVAPLELHRETFGLGRAAQRFGAEWFGNGAHPSAVLETDQPVSQEQASAIKSRFKAAVSGREPVVMGAGMSYRSIQVSPNESQFLETQKAVSVSVARIFGIQPEMIGAAVDGSSVTYANVEQRAMHYLTFGLDRWLVKVESAVTSRLPRPQFAKFNRGALLRADLLTRFQAHEIALRNHFETIDEVRDLEDRPPLSNGEEFPPGAASKMPASTEGEGERSLSVSDVERADELEVLRRENERLRRGRTLRVVRDRDGFARQVVEEPGE